MDNRLPAGLRGRVILGKGNRMDNNKLSTDLAEVGTNCISRQAAIEALERAKQNIRHNIERAIGRAICEILDEVENGIKQLPSANCSEFPNNSDTISRHDAIALWDKYHYTIAVDAIEYDSELRKLPSVQPELKKGKWIDETFKPWGLVYHPYKCDQCGEHSEADSNFCPNCGAEMEVTE